MTDLEQNLLMDFKVKVKQIIAQHEALKQEKQLLQEKIGDLGKTIDQLQQKNQLLEQKYENLKLAKVLAVADSDNKDAKNRIQKIVREIDKCIALLNK
jgi:DNA-directed RNA polymerase specialized sigma54-like protein